MKTDDSPKTAQTMESDLVFYCHLNGLPKKVKWPAKLQLDLGQCTVYCRADNAYFSVNRDSLEKFPDTKIYERGLAALKRKPATYKAFIDDVEWATDLLENRREQSEDNRSESDEPDVPECIDDDRMIEAVETTECGQLIAENVTVSDSGGHSNASNTCAGEPAARLLSYNKRRSGEIENITLKNYRHKLNMDDLDEGLIGEITEMDRYLMKSHDLIQTRGKKGGIVPVLIPPECKRVLEFLADAEVLEKVTVNGQNAYLFPQRVDTGPVRAYDSLSHMCAQFNLTKPEQITSTSLKKYMATLTKVLNLAPNELQRVCRHLGHTEKVHLSHYRTMSPFIECVNVGKILLMQDMNMQDKFVGKKLEEIYFFDIIRDDEGNRNTGKTGVTGPTPEETEATGSTQVTVATRATGPISEDVTGSDPGSDPDYADCNDMSGELDSGKVKQTKKKQTKKQRWSLEEQEELKKYFDKNLKAKVTPRMAECVKAKKQSLKEGGQLYKRHWHLIVKKVSAMMQKEKKKFT